MFGGPVVVVVVVDDHDVRTRQPRLLIVKIR
jgi:hypothetical protein